MLIQILKEMNANKKHNIIKESLQILQKRGIFEVIENFKNETGNIPTCNSEIRLETQ